MSEETRIAALNERHGISGAARIEAGNGGLPKILVATRMGSAEIYLYGAQVTSWKPAGFDEVLFVSEKSHWERGKAIRGGIPVCFPWFRGKPDDPQAPTHGFVRTKEWRLEEIGRDDGETVSVVLSTDSDGETRRWWTYEFRLEYEIRIGRSLDLKLKMQNTGSSELQFQEALHTYFRVGDVMGARVQGLDGVRYLDNRDDNHAQVQQGELVLSKQTDNAYLDATGEVAILDSALGRKLVTEKSGSVSTIVWNPWSDGAAKLADFGDDEWRGMLCVEGGNVLGQALTLGTGATHPLSISLSVHPA